MEAALAILAEHGHRVHLGDGMPMPDEQAAQPAMGGVSRPQARGSRPPARGAPSPEWWAGSVGSQPCQKQASEKTGKVAGRTRILHE